MLVHTENMHQVYILSAKTFLEIKSKILANLFYSKTFRHATELQDLF